MKKVAVSLAILFCLSVGLYLYFSFGHWIITSKSFCDGTLVFEYARDGGEFFVRSATHTASIRYTQNRQRRSIIHFTKETGGHSYRPLPINTGVLAYEMAPQQERYSNVLIVNAFLDPNDFTVRDFEKIKRCLQEEGNSINASLSASVPRIRFGGITHMSGSDFRALVRSVNTDSEFKVPGRGSVALHVDEAGVVHYLQAYAGDIFHGLSPELSSMSEIDRWDLVHARNLGGEDVYQYVARVQKLLQSQ